MYSHQDGTKRGRKYNHNTWNLVYFLAVLLWILPKGLYSPTNLYMRSLYSAEKWLNLHGLAKTQTKQNICIETYQFLFSKHLQIIKLQTFFTFVVQENYYRVYNT